jgi:hypothetical protein
MNEEIKGIKELHDSIDSPGNIASAEVARIPDQATETLNGLHEFLRSRLKTVKKFSELEEKLEEALVSRIEVGDIATGQLIQLLTSIRRENTIASGSIMDLFKGEGKDGGANPLLTDRTNGSADQLQSLFENATPEERQGLLMFASAFLNGLKPGDLEQ